MTEPAIDPSDFKSLDGLLAQLPEMLAVAPKEEGRLDLIVMRPEPDARVVPESFEVTAAGGLPGDHWTDGEGYALENGSGDPDAQICMMMSGCIRSIAGDIKYWPPAGDNFFIDMDLTPANMPPGTRFAIGSAEFIVTELRHNGCQKFIDRYGRDACLFVNTGEGKIHRLRGIYARVTQDGIVSVGDKVRKL
jgi:MOSC domain-containing protein YiiM